MGCSLALSLAQSRALLVLQCGLPPWVQSGFTHPRLLCNAVLCSVVLHGVLFPGRHIRRAAGAQSHEGGCVSVSSRLSERCMWVLMSRRFQNASKKKDSLKLFRDLFTRWTSQCGQRRAEPRLYSRSTLKFVLACITVSALGFLALHRAIDRHRDCCELSSRVVLLNRLQPAERPLLCSCPRQHDSCPE